jgi:hypothetical protein
LKNIFEKGMNYDFGEKAGEKSLKGRKAMESAFYINPKLLNNSRQFLCFSVILLHNRVGVPGLFHLL